MKKTLFVALFSFLIISSVFLLIGHVFNIQFLMFSFYKETEYGFESGGSVIPFIIGFIGSFAIGKYHEKKELLK